MGGGNSKLNVQESVQKATNKIIQSSEQNCINVCLISSEINVTVINSNVGTINIEQFCFINGVSCSLKASLETEVMNNLSSSQALMEKIFGSLLGDGPLDALGIGAAMEAVASMTPWGVVGDVLTTMFDGKTSAENIQKNYQAVVNHITQALSSQCENKAATTDAPVNIEIINSNVGVANIKTGQEISNTECNIENIGRTIVKNDLTNKQDNTLEDGTDIAGIMSAIMVVVLIAVLARVIFNHHKNHNKDDTQGDDKNTNTKGNENDNKGGNN